MLPLKTFLFIANISVALTLVGFIIFLIRFNAKQFYIKLLGLYLASSLVSTLATFVLHEFSSSTSNYAASFNTIVRLPIIVMIYYYITDGKRKNLHILVASLFGAFAIYNVLFIQTNGINSYTSIVECIIVICFAIYYFYWLLKKLPTTDLQRLPTFWINSAWIIFYSGNLFLFVFTSYLVHVLNDDLSLYWTLHNILAIIESFMIVIALWMDFRNIKSLH